MSFSPNALEITSASLDGQPVTVRRTTTALTFDLPRSVPAGRVFVLKVEYSGRPARGVTFDGSSVFTSYFACDWMICLQDAPGDKAKFALDLRLPLGLRSIALGRLRSSRRLAETEAIHSWREDTAYSPYLYGFAAGRFAEAGTTTAGVRLSYLGEGASASLLETLFAPTPAMVAFFEGKAGLPLPGGRYTQLLTPGAEAQELAGFSLIGRKVIEPMLADPQEDWAIAHELAHQWWGNLVTCKDLSEFWLNEGVTTFMVAAWKEHRWGRPAYEREMDLARRRFAAAEKAGFDVPLTFAGAYPSLGVRRAVQYYKGALFLDALRTETGDRAFWDGLRRYTREHAGAVADSRDLQRAMEQSSKSDLGPLFERWVYGTSTPRTAAPSASLQAHGR